MPPLNRLLGTLPTGFLATLGDSPRDNRLPIAPFGVTFCIGLREANPRPVDLVARFSVLAGLLAWTGRTGRMGRFGRGGMTISYWSSGENLRTSRMNGRSLRVVGTPLTNDLSCAR